MIPSALCAPATSLLSEIGPAGSLSVAMLLTGWNAPGGRGATLNENRTPSSVNVNLRFAASGAAAATAVSVTAAASAARPRPNDFISPPLFVGVTNRRRWHSSRPVRRRDGAARPRAPLRLVQSNYGTDRNPS